MAEINASIIQVERGPAVKFIFSIIKTGSGGCSKDSNEYNIGALAMVRFKFEVPYGNAHLMEIKVSTMKHMLEEDASVKMRVTCENMTLSVPESWFCTDERAEKCLGHKSYDSFKGNTTYSYRFEVKIIANKMVLLTPLYSDKNFTDFQLTATDGCVSVHKVALATHSEIFKNMLNGQWKETTERRIQLEGFSLRTLQHLKDYIYLGTLPNDGLRSLLLLAKQYLIEYLERDCILELALTVKPEALLDLLDFARENNILKLTFAVLQHTSERTVQSAYKMTVELKTDKAENKK